MCELYAVVLRGSKELSKVGTSYIEESSRSLRAITRVNFLATTKWFEVSTQPLKWMSAVELVISSRSYNVLSQVLWRLWEDYKNPVYIEDHNWLFRQPIQCCITLIQPDYLFHSDHMNSSTYQLIYLRFKLLISITEDQNALAIHVTAQHVYTITQLDSYHWSQIGWPT